MEEAEPSCDASFNQLLDRGLPTTAKNARWCPTMDLLALLTTDGQLHLHRLNWQRLWTFNPDSAITSIAWRPDGKQLAIGQEDGSVLLISSEDGEVQRSAQPFSTPVVGLAWTHSSEITPLIQTTASFVQHRDRRVLEPLLPFDAHSTSTSSHLASYDRYQGKREQVNWPPRLNALSVIACVCAHAKEIVLCSDSLFLLLRAPLAADSVRYYDLGDDSSQITATNGAGGSGVPSTVRASSSSQNNENEAAIQPVHVALPSSLTEVAACWHDAQTRSIHVALIDTACIGTESRLLRALCTYAQEILDGAAVCRELCESIEKECKTSLEGRNELARTLDRLLRDHNIDANAVGDFLLLVTMGEYSHAMEQFLTSTMQETGLKRLARTVDTALTSAHALVVEHLVPQLEALAFRLGELRGVLATPAGVKALGIRAVDVGAAENIALAQLTSAELLRQRLTVVAAQYRTFFSWLTTALRRFPEDTVDTHMGYPLSHKNTVRAFLHTEFRFSSLEPFFATAGADMPSAVESQDHEFVPIGIDGDAKEYGDDDEDTAAEDQALALFAQEDEVFLGLLTALETGVADATSAAAAATMPPFPNSDSASAPRLRVMLQRLESLCCRALKTASKYFSSRVQGRREWVLSSPENSIAATSDVLAGPQLAIYYDAHACARDISANIEKNTASGGGAGAGGDTNDVKNDHKSPSLTDRAAQAESLVVLLPRDIRFRQEHRQGILSISVPGSPFHRINLWRANGDLNTGHDNVEKLRAKIAVLPSGYALVDLDRYKEGSVLTLLSRHEVGELAQLSSHAFKPIESIDALLNDLDTNGHTFEEVQLSECRRRVLPYREVHRPLAVSDTRGVAFVLSGTQRASVFDLEEDAVPEDEDEDDEEEGDVDEDMVEGGEEPVTP